MITLHKSIYPPATIGIPNPERPESEFVKAYLTVDSSYKLEDEIQLKETIISWVKEKVAEEVPKFIEVRKDLPLTLVGKVDKKC